jgi:hypothetical protein
LTREPIILKDQNLGTASRALILWNVAVTNVAILSNGRMRNDGTSGITSCHSWALRRLNWHALLISSNRCRWVGRTSFIELQGFGKASLTT